MSEIFKTLLPSILQTKNPVPEPSTFYNSFVINRALSLHYDCILYANEMNKLPGLAKQMQYDYHLNAVRAYKRPFRKWEKAVRSEDLEAVKEYYKYNYEKARVALDILTESQIADIKVRLEKGGVSKKMSQKNGRE